MILYHFTSLYYLRNSGPDNIMTAGLKANHVSDWPIEVFEGTTCVWLTSDPRLDHIYSSHAEVRIELVIPSSDRKLVHLPKFLRRRMIPEQLMGLSADVGEAWRSFWMYLGDIPLSELRKIEYADAEAQAKFAGGV